MAFNLVEAFDPEYTSDLEQLPMEALRSKRDSCTQLETELSYLRRLAQARVDLILAESERRHSSAAELAEKARGPGRAAAADPGRHTGADEGPGRLPAFLAPAEGEQVSLAARVEEVLPSDRLGSLDEVRPLELDDLLEGPVQPGATRLGRAPGAARHPGPSPRGAGPPLPQRRSQRWTPSCTDALTAPVRVVQRPWPR